MIFHHFDKIQKPCLVFITAFITITFGVGTAMLAWVNPPTYIGQIDNEFITEDEFQSHGQTMRLTHTESRKNLDTDESVWVDIILNHERKEAAVQSTLDEVLRNLEKTAPPTQKREDFFKLLEERIKNSRMSFELYFGILKQANAIEKFLRLMGLEKRQEFMYNQFFVYNRVASPSYVETLVTSDKAIEKNKEKNREVQVLWLAQEKSLSKDKVNLKERLDRVYKENPQSFRIGKKLSGEYLILPYQTGTLQEPAPISELYRYYQQNREDFTEPQREPTDKIVYLSFEQASNRVQQVLWRQKHQTLLPQIRKEIQEAKQPSLKEVAQKYSLMYGSFSRLMEEELAEAVPELEENTGSIFRLKEGELSSSLNGMRGQMLVFITEEQRPYIPQFETLSKENIPLTSEEELALLKEYFQENMHLFEDPIRYKMEIALGNFSDFQKTHLITTSDMKDFYEQYKSVLYSGKSFAESRLNIENRLKKLQTGDEIPRLISEFKRKLDEDKEHELSFSEVAKSLHLAVFSSEKPLKIEEIQEKFPFLGENLEQIKKLQVGRATSVLYSKEGYPFLVYMTQIKQGTTPKFKDIQTKVREKLIEEEAELLAKKDLETYQKTAEKDFEKAIKERSWSKSNWLSNQEEGKEFPKDDQKLLLERVWNLKKVGDIGELVLGKNAVYLVRLENERFPDVSSIKKFAILKEKETLLADQLESLQKKWADYEMLKEFGQLKLIKSDKQKQQPASSGSIYY
ncbi:MAG: hypothetical protein AABZ60_25000 [Planctomycetota bacterium]